MSSTWWTAVVNDRNDPAQAGRLRLVIGGLTGSRVYPGWVPALVPGGTGPGACGLLWIPPVNTIVYVLQTGPELLHWTSGPVDGQASLPAELKDGYPDRSGFSDPSGATTITASRSEARLTVPAVTGRVRLGASDADQAAIRGDRFVGDLQPALNELVGLLAGLGFAAPLTAALVAAMAAEVAGGAAGVYLSRRVRVST